MSRRSFLLAGIAAANLVIWTFKVLGSRVGNIFRAQPYGNLNSIISFSSRLIAASRALETEEDDPIIRDELAASLAGPGPLERARSRAQAAPEGSGRKFKVGPMALRTWWFDQRLLTLLESGKQGPGPRQVVVLGAGMDTRPWRLQLPLGVSWYEVDRSDVLAAKRHALKKNGAGLEPGHTRKAYPLLAGSWKGVEADLEEPGWWESLLASGFDPGSPVVWLAEGLLMYLEGKSVASLLSTISRLSSQNSALLTMSLTESMLNRLSGVRSPRAELIATWKFGCPTDPTDYFAALGWEVESISTRADMATALKLDPEICQKSPSASPGGGTLFIVAAPLAPSTEAI
ncbi:hypothetical protein ACKKBG_A32875 [Auxenochlorella protothecoides x Auxenochlorella symbiontica]